MRNFESAEAGEAAAVMSMRGLETSVQQPRPRPKSGFYSVDASGRKWHAQITCRQATDSGTKEAAPAYDAAARQQKRGERGVVYNFESAEAGEAAVSKQKPPD
jgi:hypothetical protein